MLKKLAIAFTLAAALSPTGAIAQLEPDMIRFSSSGKSVPCESLKNSTFVFNISAEREIIFNDKYPEIKGNPALSGAGQGDRATIRFKTTAACTDSLAKQKNEGKVNQIVFDFTQSPRPGRKIAIYPIEQGPPISIGESDPGGNVYISIQNIHRDYGMEEIGLGGGFALKMK